MYRLLTRAEVLILLASYGAAFVREILPGCEEWRTDDGFAFCLTPEDDGLYHEFMILEAVARSLAPRQNRKTHT